VSLRGADGGALNVTSRVDCADCRLPFAFARNSGAATADTACSGWRLVIGSQFSSFSRSTAVDQSLEAAGDS
jgi:hypothetical protein